jgi:tight adherence protein B
VTSRAVGFIAACVAACVCCAAAASASEPIRLTEAGNGTFPERTYVLSLPAGKRLQPSAVKVTENGHRVVALKIAPAGTTGTVLSGTVLAIDASNSMSGAPIQGAVDAARAFAARRNVNQRLAILTFNNTTHVPLALTASQSAIDSALSRSPSLHYKTHLYDGVAQAITLLRASGIDAGSVVVLSDGTDVGSTVTLDEVVQSAKATHTRIFAVGLSSKTFHPGPLQRLATETGGSYSTANSPTDLKRIYDQLGLELAQDYILTYNSIVKPGRHVNLDVSVAGAGSATAAYVAPMVASPNALYHKSAADKVWQSAFTMLAIALLIPALVAAAIFVPLRRRGSTVRSRVSDYVSMPRGRELDALVNRVFTGTERSLERTQWWQRFKDALEFADVPFPAVYVAVGTFIVTVFATYVLWAIGGPLGLLGLGIPLIVRTVILGRAARKRRAFADQLPDNLDVLTSGLRAGHSLIGALAVVVTDAAEPSRTEFQGVIADEQLGVPLEAALDKVVERMRSRDLEQVALVASLQSETGGNAAEVLDRVTETIRERMDLRRLARTLTAQGRLARWIVSLLPIGILIAINVIAPDYMKPMFTHTSGLIMLTVGAISIIAGSFVIGRIVEIDV